MALVTSFSLSQLAIRPPVLLNLLFTAALQAAPRCARVRPGGANATVANPQPSSDLESYQSRHDDMWNSIVSITRFAYKCKMPLIDYMCESSAY